MKASGGFGSIISALVMSQRGLPRRFVLFMYWMWAIAIGSIAFYGISTHVWHLMLACLLDGLCVAAGMVTWTTMMHRLVPRSLLGRVSSLDWFISISLVPVSYAITGPVAGAIGTRPTLIGAGVLGTLATLAFLAIPNLRDPEEDPRMTGKEQEVLELVG